MRDKQNEKQITVILGSELLERLDNMAKHVNLSRHRLILNFMTVGIEQIELLENVKIFQLAILIRDMSRKLTADVRKELQPSEMPIPIRMEELLVSRLDRLANKADLSRNQLARNIITSCLEELESARRYGLTKITMELSELGNKFQNIFETGKRAFAAGKEKN